MIEQIEGALVERLPTEVQLRTGPLVLQLAVPLSTSRELPQSGVVRLHTHLRWTEDGPLLFGFSTSRERDLFRLLLSVQGVGPRAALSLLSHLPLPDLIRQIRERSVQGLTRIPGIGPKTAGRILVDLGPKIDKLALSPEESPLAGRAASEQEDDAAAALTALGYASRDARKAVQRVLHDQPGGSLDEVIRLALRLVSTKTSSGD